jgi:flagellar hook-associated protein 3 FlgL
MRVSSNMIHNTSFDAIGKHQADLLKIQEQMSSGKQINRPSDDPVGTTQIHRLNKTMNTIDQYADNGRYAKSQLVLEETAITNTVDVLQRVRELAVQMSTDTYNEDQRRQTASEVSQLMLHVKSIMNQKNSDGEFLFSGNNVKDIPFVDDPNNPGFLTYIGNPVAGDLEPDNHKPDAIFGGRFVKIGFDVNNELKPNDEANMSRVRVTDSGNQVFGFYKTREELDNFDYTQSALEPDMDPNIYNVMRVMHDRLLEGERPGDDVLEELRKGIDNMSANMAVIGSRQNRIEAQYDAGETYKIALTERRMVIEDKDLVEGISEFTLKENALQMAQQVFQRVQQMSLFDYLR